MQEIDINITQIKKQDHKTTKIDLNAFTAEITGKNSSKLDFAPIFQKSKLVLDISGKSVNTTVVNTLRRLSMDYVPTYAFPPESITIEKNTSVFNNDMMRNRLSQLTIPNIANEIYFLEDKFWKGINFANPNRDKHPDDKKVLEFYLNATNNTNDIMNVNTGHAKVYEDGIELKDVFDKNYSDLIIQLRPKEVFSCKCVGILSIGKNNNIWAASGNTYYDDINDNKFEFTVESQRQMKEYEILIKSCKILKEKIKLIKKTVSDKYDKPEITNGSALKIILENEDHTLGNIINECLQTNKNVLYSGMSKPDLLVDNMVIKFTTAKKNPLIPLFESLDYITKLYNKIETLLEALSKKK